jgi:EAL domain-containing protein (putative c-di-GMP-specific phosphodiesterase class I)
LQTELRERERAEARVRQLNMRLEERVVQRTRELEAAHQELEETTILELIAQNAPLTESIVKAAIELGHSFGLDVVAEGVETAGARDLLENLGCDYAQGFLFAKPMASSDFLAWYEEQSRGRS